MSIVGRVPLAESPDEQTSEIKRIVISSILGTAVEWYDFLIYGTASALVFNKLFFPLSNPTLGTIAAFGTYGVGFLARPLGAAIFGHFGDRVGRKAMLAMTIVIMGLGTFCDCFRASGWAVSGVVPCSWWSRMRPPGAAGFWARWYSSVIRSVISPQSARWRCYLSCLRRTFWRGAGAFRS
jgi:MFS family permease